MTDELAAELDDIEIVDNLDETQDQIPFRYSITSYGADFLIDGVVKRMDEDSIIIPSFQRGFVWSYNKASRFVESLLLGLPVPGIFLSRDLDTEQLIVIDGQQRLKSLHYFYSGYFIDPKRTFTLEGIDSAYRGMTYDDLRPEDKRRLSNSILHATIVKQDEPSDDNSSIFLIFERLNTGGMSLTPQEIRACIFHGVFNDLLNTLNTNDNWRSIFGRAHRRMRDAELILRFFALYFTDRPYSPPMKGFLNDFMGHNRCLEYHSADVLTNLFDNAIDVIFQALGSSAFKPRGVLNAAVYDAVMVGIATRLEGGPISNFTEVLNQYKELLKDAEFERAYTSQTADPEKVRYRISSSIEAFADVE